MKVFKFGGASVKDSKSVLNLVNIIKLFPKQKIWIVVSAMGKMTNLLEHILEDYFNQRDPKENIDKFVSYHISILADLFPFRSALVYGDVYNLIEELKNKLSKPSSKDYNKEYSTIVSFGELISTKIVSHVLSSENLNNEWIDIRDVVTSKEGYCQVDVDWSKTNKNIQRLSKVSTDVDDHINIKVTQGFIAANEKKETTTLGREGSDFTGAILAWCLDAESLTIWKDVAGLMNADPKKFPEAVLLKKISYREALELSFYGATVIHPKTIKPLQNKLIPLKVKSFVTPEDEGTIIEQNEDNDNVIPSFISKSNQVLLSISPRDFSMVVEKNISELYDAIAEIGININLMQNSALNFSICFDYNENRLVQLQEVLIERYKLLYNNKLELLTIRHYTDDVVDSLLENRKVLLEQRSRHTARFLLEE